MVTGNWMDIGWQVSQSLTPANKITINYNRDEDYESYNDSDNDFDADDDDADDDDSCHPARFAGKSRGERRTAKAWAK